MNPKEGDIIYYYEMGWLTIYLGGGEIASEEGSEFFRDRVWDLFISSHDRLTEDGQRLYWNTTTRHKYKILGNIYDFAERIKGEILDEL